MHGGGGVSDPPDVLRRRLFGVPIANCTDGGEIEFISQLLLRRSDRFILIGCDRGIAAFEMGCNEMKMIFSSLC